ncbi:P-loop containing nucleoside triphosphate hydrolase protein [Tylopilus felleus]
MSLILGFPSNPRIRVKSLLVSPISKASAQQRAGRAGRTRPGKCFRLYTKKDFISELEERTHPEILRSNLANTVLELVKASVKDLVWFDHVDAPAPEMLMRALELLNFLEALDDDDNLTPLGSIIAEFPLDPQLSKMLIASPEFQCSSEILTITAMLSIPGRRESNAAQAMLTVPNGNHLTLVNVYNSYIQECPLAAGAYYEVALLSTEDERKRSINNQRALCCGFFMQVAHKEGDKCNYVMVKDNRVISLHPSCGLDKQPEWVIFNEFVLTMRPYISKFTIYFSGFLLAFQELLELAPLHFDLSSFSDGEAKRSLQPRRQASSDGSEMVRNLPRKSRKRS